MGKNKYKCMVIITLIISLSDLFFAAINKQQITRNVSPYSYGTILGTPRYMLQLSVVFLLQIAVIVSTVLYYNNLKKTEGFSHKLLKIILPILIEVVIFIIISIFLYQSIVLI